MKSLLAFAVFAVTAVSAYPMLNATKEDFRILKRVALTQVFTSCTKPNVIALTFDDGPYQWHEQISQMLLQAGAKGTFFVNDDCIYSESVASQLIQSFRNGHQIASHTWSHPHLNSTPAEQQVTELSRLDTALQKIIGIKPAFVRPPYGEYNNQFVAVAASNGQTIVIWDFDSRDAVGSTVEQSKHSYDQILSSSPDNLLTLNHETHETTVFDLLPYILDNYSNSGYRFVTVAECLGMDPYISQGKPGTRDDSWNCN